MIKCVIVDDKPLAIDILTDYISKVPFLSLVHSSVNPLEALEFVRSNTADLIFLDIQMPELTGIQFMNILEGKCKVILTTAYAKYALEGYEHDVVDYLLKPVPFDRFYKAVDKARKIISADSLPVNNTGKVASPALAEDLFVKTEYKIQRVPLESILFIEARQNYIAIITADKQVLTLQNIKAIEEKLPADRFSRVHKSYIVAVNKIDIIEKSSIQINKHLIPIGDAYRDAFFARIH